MHRPRPRRHLHYSELRWFDLPHGALSDVIEDAALVAAEFPGLAERLAACRQAAWRCETFLAFPGWGPDRRRAGALLWREGSPLDYYVDLDAAGDPIGIELVSEMCHSR